MTEQLMQVFQLNTADILNKYSEYVKKISYFDERLKLLGDFVSFSGRRYNQTVHGRVLGQFKTIWYEAKVQEDQRLKDFFCRFMYNLNEQVRLAAENIDMAFTDRFEYIFQALYIQEKQIRARIGMEEILPDINIKLKYTQYILTKHKYKHYNDIFSPSETTVQCLDLNNNMMVLGGWDGCVSVYTFKGGYLCFEEIQPIVEVPIKYIRIIERTIFLKDQLNRLSLYFYRNKQLYSFRTYDIGHNFVFISKRFLDRSFAVLTVKDKKIKVIDVKYQNKGIELDSNLVEDDSHLLNYRGKVLIVSQRNLVVFDNMSRTIEREFEKCFNHNIEEIQLHNGRFLVSWSQKSLHYDEFRGDSLHHIFTISLEMRPSLLRVINNIIYLSVDGILMQILSDRTMNKITAGYVFEFGITDMKLRGETLVVVGRDNKKQVKLYDIVKDNEK